MSTLTKQQKEEVVQLIQEFIDCGRIFTALDVSNEFKQTFGWVNHWRVAKYIRESDVIAKYCDDHHYTRTLCAVTMNGIKANVFHPIFVGDPCSVYTDTEQEALKPDDPTIAGCDSTSMLIPIPNRSILNTNQPPIQILMSPLPSLITPKVISDAVNSRICTTGLASYTFSDIIKELSILGIDCFSRADRKKVSDYLRRHCNKVSLSKGYYSGPCGEYRD